ncbi:MAG: hypothetical protein PHI45_00365 [Candidatus Pacebacteria bacterium]|jgi:hypothetical protein|nr:hypothetical protein [Candidatus Paceibacterota bacterium]MDD5752532.1 hypothetical protein [Candidatus Paceibacterota bacterium]
MGNGKEKRRRQKVSKKEKPSKIVEKCREKTQGQRSRFRQKKT